MHSFTIVKALCINASGIWMTGIWSKLTLVYVCSRQNRCNIVSKYMELKNSVSPFSLCPSRSFLFHSECCFLLCCCRPFLRERKERLPRVLYGMVGFPVNKNRTSTFIFKWTMSVCLFSLFLAVSTFFAVLLLSCLTVYCFVNDLCWFCCCWCFSFFWLLPLKHPWFGDDREGVRCFHWKRFWQLI